jgi:hypothetical protein
MTCELCNKESNGLKGLSIHLKKKHNFNDTHLKINKNMLMKYGKEMNIE